MSRIHGCVIERFDHETCEAVLDWVAGGTAPPGCDHGFTWLLAHCRDGVTWGRKDGSAWRLSATLFPDLCPTVSRDNLLELRLFGEEGEVLIWRSEAQFLGRCLLDKPHHDMPSATRPDDDIRVLEGDRLIEGPKDGFTRVGTAAGPQQAVPLACTAQDFERGRWPLRLRVRHYFEEDPQTGAVRVAASRLVHVFKEVR